jgi:hypothetical protein
MEKVYPPYEKLTGIYIDYNFMEKVYSPCEKHSFTSFLMVICCGHYSVEEARSRSTS